MRLGLGTDISVGYRQPLFGGVPLLLDTYTGAAAAYSLRQLRTGVTNVVRVRRSSDNAEADFNPTEITNGTLATWVGGQNLALRSEEFNLSPWQSFTSVVTQSTETTPDGDSTNKYIKVVDDNSGGTGIVSIGQSVNVSPSTQYTASFFLKADGVSFVRLDANGAGIVGDPSPTAYFGLSGSGVLGAKSSGMDDSAIEAYPNGWYRCSITWTQGAGDSAFTFFLRLASSISSVFVPRDGTSSIFVWGAQVNEGATAGDYVPTTSNVSGDGFVTTWYDQSGNANDATQATAASQPKIVDSGVLVTDNGKPAVEFDSTDDRLSAGDVLDMGTNDLSIFATAKQVVNNDGWFMAKISTSVNEGYGIFHQTFARLRSRIRSGGNNIDTSSTSSEAVNSQGLSTAIFDRSADMNVYFNGAFSNGVDISGFSGNDISNNIDFYIGYGFLNVDRYYGGLIQEIIIYDFDQSSNRTAIEENINDHYSIYP